MNKYQNNPQEISLKYLKEILDIIGIIETKGSYYKQIESEKEKITETQISDILFSIQDFENKEDWGRTIKTAKKIFNSTCKSFEITGNRTGTFIHPTSQKAIEIVKDPGYQTLLILALALMNTKNTLNIDFLNQLLFQKQPLGLILFLNYAIETKLVVTFQYKSNRVDSSSFVSEFVSVKMNFRDGHWLLIGWDVQKSYWNQYLIHSIQNIEPVFESGNKDLKYFKNIPELNIDEFYKYSFGIAVLKDQKPIEIQIQVPLDKVNDIKKRRREGEWINKEDYMIWKVYAYNENEVFDYVFRWDGILKIVSPPEIIEKFQKKLKKFIV